MNLSLADPFSLSQDYPEAQTHSLKYGHATVVSFNKTGDLLASGRSDGTVVLFDVETAGLARILTGHTRQIQSLSWSRSGRYLLSSSQDWKAILWDLEDGSRLRLVRFEAPIYIGELHPFNHFKFVVALYEDQPYIVDISSHKPEKQVFSSVPRRPQRDDAEEGEIDEKRAAQDAKQMTSVVLWDTSGDYIFAATNKGWVNIIRANTSETIHSTRLTNSVITFARLSKSGRQLLVNSSDRVLRTVYVPHLGKDIPLSEITLEVEHKFQDVVNRLLWNHCGFSNTGEYITASTYKNHDIYIWERTKGSLVKILEGPKEELGVLDWHPNRPMLVAVGIETGRIYIWATNNPQRWSALAPDFQELEENVEYIEREDEFDIQDRDKMTKRRLDLEDEEVDVVTIEPTSADDAEAEGDGWTMPVLLDIEESSSDDDIKVVGPTAATSTSKRSPVAGKRGRKKKNAD